jgi:hypothetical protein
MTFELNEVEARQEEYPSTLSYLKLLNVLIEHESDAPDKGARYVQQLGWMRVFDLPAMHEPIVSVIY